MVAHATRIALGRRAEIAVSWLDRWSKQLFQEMKNQNIEYHASGDGSMPFNLTRREARLLIEGMAHHAAEMRKFLK